MDKEPKTRVVVFSTLFPSPGAPNAGIFVRERMFRVARHLPMVVVSPQAWFPFQGVLRRFKPHFRPAAPATEVQHGIEVLHPRFLCFPGIFKSLDGPLLALSTYSTMRRLSKRFNFDVIDAHFAYPDGYAAVRLGKWLKRPVTITLRGTEIRHSRTQGISAKLKWALTNAQRIFSVSDSLRRHAIAVGVEPPEKTVVVGNGVDTGKFFPLDKEQCRRALSIPCDAKVLITVGGLVERKGFHRVIELLPRLRTRCPDLRYLIVGGPSTEGDWSDRLQRQVKDLELGDCVSFLGPLPHDAVKQALSAADIFVLATRNEGWANVILEAMACGLPVIATDVGGNAEVVSAPELGSIVPFDDAAALAQALVDALTRTWDTEQILAYAAANSWDLRVNILVPELEQVARRGKSGL